MIVDHDPGDEDRGEPASARAVIVSRVWHGTIQVTREQLESEPPLRLTEMLFEIRRPEPSPVFVDIASDDTTRRPIP